jgi:LAGLIDADG DNA endonuclease family protein
MNFNKGKGISDINFNENTYNSTTPLYQVCWGAGHMPYSRSLIKSSPINQKREFHHKVKAKNRIGPHNIDTLSIILGSLLGNGNIKKLVEGSMLVVRETNKEYALWLYKILYNRGYTSNLQPRQYTRTFRSKEGKEYYGYEFNTFTFRSFNWIHSKFYNKGRKVIPENIYEYLTPLALAIWIMDDAGYTNYGLRIATNSFKLKEVELLQDVIKSKYDLETTILNIYIKDQYSIYIKQKSFNNLRNIVGPYIHFSMLHKLGISK